MRLLVALLVLLLAGCTASMPPPPAIDVAQREARVAAEAVVGGEVRFDEAGKWNVMAWNASAGAAAGATWILPPDALVESQGEQVAILEIIPVWAGSQPPAAMGFYVFSLGPDGPRHGGGLVLEPLNVVQRSGAPVPTAYEQPANLAPARLRLPGFASGDPIGIVATASGATASAGWAWSPAQEDVGALDPDLLEKWRQEGPARLQVPQGHAPTWSDEVCVSLNLKVVVVAGLDAWSQGATCEQLLAVDPRPQATLQRTRMLVGQEGPGWGLVTGFILGEAGMDSWDLQVGAAGQSQQLQGEATSKATVAGVVLQFNLAGDGTNGTLVAGEAELRDATLALTGIAVQSLHFGADMTTLLGTPAPPSQSIETPASARVQGLRVLGRDLSALRPGSGVLPS